MLLNRLTAEGIAAGTVTLVLRRWDRPRAKAGGTQRTVAGTIRIDAATERAGDYRVTAAQARAAGYADIAGIGERLDSWDAATEPWTRNYLRLIGDNEAIRAPDLAERVGIDVPRFKRRVRQLKGLGLTISLGTGYRLSPRGAAFLRADGHRPTR